MEKSAQHMLVNFVLDAINADSLPAADFDLQPYQALLAGKAATDWQPIFSKLEKRVGDWSSNSDVQADLNSMGQHLFPGGDWLKDWVRTSPSLDNNADFNHWTYAFKAALSETTGQLGQAHISLYHEFQLMSALIHASDCQAQPAESFTLITGDFPGIQRTIYTITSSGATKGVRGRSFFLQLLAEAVVLRLLDELELPRTNALYVAGGNFQIIAPAGEAIQQTTDAIRIAINEQLLEVFGGDLALVITASNFSRQALLGADKTTYQQHKDSERRLKTKPFNGIAKDKLFKAEGAGSQHYCAICHREPLTEDEITEARRLADTGEEWVAPEQQAFIELARDLARVQRFLDADNVATAHTPGIAFSKGQAGGDLSLEQLKQYELLLEKITGYRVKVGLYHEVKDRDIVLRLGSARYDLEAIQGYALLAAHTPVVSQEDVDWWDENKPRRSIDEDDNFRIGESIRNFTMLAYQSRNSGLARYGVLRMDIDGLGAIFRDQLKTTPERVVTSALLSRFFDGYLPRICGHYEAQFNRENSIYLIYGGGDDLFIVGEWDILPHFAEYLRTLLVQYSHGTLTISAGIELFPAHYPFYRAADEADAALDAAKSRDGKDAITFLNEMFGWGGQADWQEVKSQYSRIRNVTQALERRTAIRNVVRIYERWQDDVRKHGTDYIHFGPFLWQAAYQIARIHDMLKTDDKHVKQDIDGIKRSILDEKHIRPSGIAARWVELELRTQEKET